VLILETTLWLELLQMGSMLSEPLRALWFERQLLSMGFL
jgi:hypothetical protein